MKKIFYSILFAGFTLSSLQAQDISDAVRFSQDNLNGTARFRAMGGAFGALGGDMSSLNVNPAGSAVFINNQVAFTLSNYNTKNNSNYFGTPTSEKENTFTLNQGGAVFAFHNRNSNSKWKKFSMGFNYDNTNNYNSALFTAGTNPTNSIADYFLSYANGVPLDLLENGYYRDLGNGAQQAFLGYQGYIINPVSNTTDNTQYVSNVLAGGNYYQENEVYTSGYNGKFTFNLGTQYDDFLYLGMNLNLHTIDYRRSSSFYEDNSNPLGADYQVTNVRFDNDLYTYGSGFSFQLGAIAKVTDAIRLGLAYESNTWYTVYDELSQRISSVSSNNVEELAPDVVDPLFVNVYEPSKLQTPGKWTGSFAYVFGQSGLISVDYAIKNYGNTTFKPENDRYYSDLNASMSNQLKTNGELRVGGEYKIKQLSLRAGYRFEGSPYKDGKTIGDLNAYSGGIGYNFGATKLDVSYSFTERDSQRAAFSQGFTDYSNINTKYNNVSVSLLFEL
ncbi:transporter [Flavobacterium agrisoli]|uniref:Transporter n=1 Tax=Flavobacterium agrisoli TaxID=2793066 RepID=A0A934UKJ0_9FLAO|nr:transporter [Flavobacterium agrisoli]MBK0371146.1 transporter [Flavobacterium agrisoli]